VRLWSLRHANGVADGYKHSKSKPLYRPRNIYLISPLHSLSEAGQDVSSPVLAVVLWSLQLKRKAHACLGSKILDRERRTDLFFGSKGFSQPTMII